MNIINAGLKSCVDSIRSLIYPSLDNLNQELIELLHGISGVLSFEDSKRDQVVFVLPLTKIHTFIDYPPHKTGYSIRELVKQAYSMSFDDLTTEIEIFTDLLSKLNFKCDISKLLH